MISEGRLKAIIDQTGSELLSRADFSSSLSLVDDLLIYEEDVEAPSWRDRAEVICKEVDDFTSTC